MTRRFLFFTNTRWDEAPRLRHQLARLLAGAGHEVLFFEKPTYPWQSTAVSKCVDTRIALVPQRELIHHKLRLGVAIHRANAVVAARSIRASLDGTAATHRDPIVVNFNYDYWFLRDMFPTNRLITIINDDFVSSALGGYTKPLMWALARTCRSSDHVLTVSPPLQDQLRPFCDPLLFQPWADCSYRSPVQSASRHILLFWGHVNRRVDYAFVQAAAERLARERPDVRLMIVGPAERHVAPQLHALSALGNVQISPATPLDNLPLASVLAGLIPVRAGVPEYDAIVMPNKALQLLARGLPLLISGMPHFTRAPFVIRADPVGLAAQVDSLRRHFDDLQPAIEACVAGNGADARLAQFSALLD